jgi:hypothetical protein
MLPFWNLGPESSRPSSQLFSFSSKHNANLEQENGYTI